MAGTNLHILRKESLYQSAVLICAAVLGLGACSERELILKGEREAVLLQVSTLDVDSAAAAEFGAVGPAIENEDAGQAGLSSGHAGGHLSLATPLKQSWRARIAGPDDVCRWL